MRPEPCPNPEDLQKFVRCSVTERQADCIGEHLEVCPTCERAVVDLERDSDTVAEHIRKAAAEHTFAHEPECYQILRALLKGAAAGGVALPPSDLDLPVDHSLRDYQIISKLGEGGMGAVYKAIHQRLKKTVALKVLPTSRIGDQPAVARFEREMSVLGQLNHPHIVQALDAGEHDGQHYLVMEFVAGSDLSDLIKRCSPLSIADSCRLISQAALGLQYAHEHGFVHRDIKPSNLMLARVSHPTGESQAIVKILDLGLARPLDQPTGSAPAKADLTTTGQVMGTLDYMAPEQGGDAHQVDIRADIYSLGATLYKLLTSDSPYAEHAGKPPLQRLMAIAQHEPPPIRTKRPDVPDKLAAIVHRMLSKKPENRFATPAEVAQALEPYCSGADLAALLIPQEESRLLDARSQVASPRKAADGDHKGRRRRRTGMAAFGAFFFLAGILVVTTRRGTVHVTAPNGKLPDDVKVQVSRGGELIELLQADNQWSAKIVNGEYQVQLRGGEDRFDIKDSKLIVGRMGRVAVMVELRKPHAAPNPPVVATARANGTPKGTSPPLNAAAVAPTQTSVNAAKPYTIVRDGKDLRSFKSLPGAIENLKPGDAVEVRSNDQLAIQLSEPIAKPLLIRAGAGYRPTLAIINAAENASQYIFITADVTVVNCDLDLRSSRFFGDSKSSWTMEGCRLWGYPPPALKKWTAKNCVLALTDGFNPIDASSTECVLENCVIRNRNVFFASDLGSHTLRLRNCTYYAVDTYSPTFARVGEKATLTVEAVGNVFHCRSQGLLMEGTSLPRIIWQGQGNCFSGMCYGVWEEKPDKSIVLKEQGLVAWNKLWKEPERDSQEVEFLAFEWGRIQRLDGPEQLREIRASIQKLPADRNSPDIGPEWDLVGPGDAYLRALSAEGRGHPASELRPERLDGGPFVLARDGQTVRGYLTLKEAIDAAQDGDIVEIRTDGPVAHTIWSGESRLLTIRAAAGYSPVVEGGLLNSGTDRLILEGLTIRAEIQASGGYARWEGENLLFPQRGSILRLMNCDISASGSSVSGWMFQHGDIVPEIVNCHCPWFAVAIPAGGVARFRNSVFGCGSADSESQTGQPGILEIDRCVFWQPELIGPWVGVSFITQSPVAFISRGSIFVSSTNLFASTTPGLKWQGTANVFVKLLGFQRRADDYTLAQFQAQFKTDGDSIELPPWEIDPAQWRILPDKSPGYQPRPDGTDYGADIDELVKVIGLDTNRKATPPPQ